MSFPEAFKGAKAELASIRNPVQRLRRAGELFNTFAAELVGLVSLAPYGARANRLYKTLSASDRNDKHGLGVKLERDIVYGAAERNVMDIYHPIDAADADPEQDGAGTPVVLFCHGGVWATGDKWNYAPLATRVAQSGCMVAVMHYSLYPEAKVSDMIEEVDQAVSAVMNVASQYGGDPARLHLVGHSAGAQMVAMAMLRRAQAAHEAEGADGKKVKPDDRMPAMAVGMAGVYDIFKHYKYERGRGVHEISTMKRAVGGFERMASQSPCIVLGNALAARDEAAERVAGAAASEEASGTKQDPKRRALEDYAEDADCPFESRVEYDQQFALRGDGLARRLGFGRVAADDALGWLPAAYEDGADEDIMHFDIEAAKRLPPFVLTSSLVDTTVPWVESSEFYYRLVDAGVKCKHLVYSDVGHADFVLKFGARWKKDELPNAKDEAKVRHSGSDLAPSSRDLINIVTGEVDPFQPAPRRKYKAVKKRAVDVTTMS